MKRTSFNLSPEAEKYLRDMAAKRGVTMGEVLRHALTIEKYLAEQKAAGNTVLIQSPDKKMRELLVV
jgi:hypothetical protein